MNDIADYEALEQYIERGICKIIGPNFVNQDNIDRISSKVVVYHDKYDSTKNMSYDSYVYMIIKTACMSIFRETFAKRNKKSKLLNAYIHDKKPSLDRYNKHSESFMYLVDVIIEHKDITAQEKSILEKRYVECKSVRKVAEELGLEKKDIHRIVKNSFIKIRELYPDIESLEKEVELKYGKIIN
jgi:RNA polymerase sigma factor (sigma-70 family)